LRRGQHVLGADRRDVGGVLRGSVGAEAVALVERVHGGARRIALQGDGVRADEMMAGARKLGGSDGLLAYAPQLVSNPVEGDVNLRRTCSRTSAGSTLPTTEIVSAPGGYCCARYRERMPGSSRATLLSVPSVSKRYGCLR